MGFCRNIDFRGKVQFLIKNKALIYQKKKGLNELAESILPVHLPTKRMKIVFRDKRA